MTSSKRFEACADITLLSAVNVFGGENICVVLTECKKIFSRGLVLKKGGTVIAQDDRLSYFGVPRR